MSKEITKMVLEIFDEKGNTYSLVRPFEMVKYNYRTDINTKARDLEILISSLNDVSKAEYYNLGNILKEIEMNNENKIKQVILSYTLKDSNVETEEKIELFNSNYITNYNNIGYEFSIGVNFGKYEEDTKNDLYLSSLVKYNFIFR